MKETLEPEQQSSQRQGRGAYGTLPSLDALLPQLRRAGDRTGEKVQVAVAKSVGRHVEVTFTLHIWQRSDGPPSLSDPLCTVRFNIHVNARTHAIVGLLEPCLRRGAPTPRRGGTKAKVDPRPATQSRARRRPRPRNAPGTPRSEVAASTATCRTSSSIRIVVGFVIPERRCSEGEG
jgi:hypothetical protein